MPTARCPTRCNVDLPLPTERGGLTRMTEPREARRSWVEQIMGMPVSVLARADTARDPDVAQAVAAVFAELREVDDRFSPYRYDSEISRVARGELALADCCADVQEVAHRCEVANALTGGLFDATRPDGRWDPSGLVKGWATERAMRHLAAARGPDWCLNCGGDVIATAPSGQPFVVGIADPADPTRVIARIPCTLGAVATSGTAARGAHLYDPRTGRPADLALRAVTVAGPSLETADMIATAGLRRRPMLGRGRDRLRRLCRDGHRPGPGPAAHARLARSRAHPGLPVKARSTVLRVARTRGPGTADHRGMTAELALGNPVRARVRPRRGGARRAACLGAVTASVLAVLALWISGDGLTNLTSSRADALTSLGRLAGLLSADLLLVQVLLMARVPVIERCYGQDVLTRLHRVVGFSSVALLAAHLAAVLPGYAALTGTGVARQTWLLVRSAPGILLAVAGTAALLLVTVTSIRRARRALRYESWHLLHLYAYLGVGLALPHQMWAGQDFVASPLARAYWWSLYGAVAAAVLIFRLGLPIGRSLRHGLTVDTVTEEAAGVVTVAMRGRALHRLPARAGQYLVWRFLDGPGWSRGHPYSLSAAPGPEQVRITANDNGDDPGRLARLRPGTWVLIEGPYGRLAAGLPLNRPLAMLACGIGITPIRALVEDLPPEIDAVLVYRARTLEHALMRGEIDEIAARRGTRVQYLLGPRAGARSSWLPETAAHRADREVLLDLIPDLPDRDLVVCGPEPWADAVCAAAAEVGLPRTRVHRERFAW